MDSPHSQTQLDHLLFKNHFTRELAADPQVKNYRRQVTDACFSRVYPSPVSAPELIAWSSELARELGLDESTVHSKTFVDIFTGDKLLPAMDPYAMCYGGHQFGHWAGQLGDGRAINLGDIQTKTGRLLTLQLKGAGPTPYSRSADGLAVLRSSVREFLCSEAMFHLGIPTTRALSLTLTGDQVLRDMFYDGNPEYEPGAVVCRVAPSFIRLGSFEIFASRGDFKTLKSLLNFTVKHYFPEIEGSGTKAYIDLFREVCLRTAALIVEWQGVGFVHGVMNTDNLSVLGLTIDYGPYGWLEGYDLAWTPNTTDAQGRRYCFANQPQIGQWNLLQFANALYPLIKDEVPLKEALEEYATVFEQGWHKLIADKLGLSDLHPVRDQSFLNGLFELLEARETDMTLFFRYLNQVDGGDGGHDFETLFKPLLPSLYSTEALSADYKNKAVLWLQEYRSRIESDAMDKAQRLAKMNACNPLYVLRNYLAQLAIDKASEGDYSRIAEQLEVLRTPYTEQAGKEQFAEKRPEWARHRAGCSMLSCSS